MTAYGGCRWLRGQCSSLMRVECSTRLKFLKRILSLIHAQYNKINSEHQVPVCNVQSERNNALYAADDTSLL